MPTRFHTAAAAAAFVSVASGALAQTPSRPNPFLPPQASKHFAPDRDCDLKNVLVDLKVDYPNKMIIGAVENRLAPFKDGLTVVTLHCGKNIQVLTCSINGSGAKFTRTGDILKITSPTPLPAGKPVSVITRYTVGDKKVNNGFMADSGWHWIRPNGGPKTRVGFWTQGEAELNREWAPTWDYPNNLATSETRVTVPADWTVIGNGTLKSNTLSADGKTRTFDWQMTLPHATYLLSLVGGPFDIKTATWRGIPLMYVAPKGKGYLLEDSFSDTPDMLSYFSDILGVKYAWPKYAENAMYDFGGGMENVSATTLPESSLTDRREGYRTMASLNAHELAHQWFGDLVTCRDWGNIWLNESFATYFEALYMEHSRGADSYAYEVYGDMQGYIGESKQYKRPIATNMYPNADSMFDAHTYPKGGAVLHTMRRYLGDRLFFAGLHHYLTTYQHSPVVSADLCRAMTDATGFNLEPFFQQWIWAPGHPVVDYSWTWDEAANRVKLLVKQTQDTKDGTPIYSLGATVGVIRDGKITRTPISLSKAIETFEIAAAGKPDAVVFDPDHDFLRETPELHWAASELPFIVKYGACAVDRSEALSRLLAGAPSDAAVQTAVEALRADSDKFPVFRSLARLPELKRPDLRGFFREQLTHPDFDRRTQAVSALAQLPVDPADVDRMKKLVNNTEPYSVVIAAITALSAWDAAGSRAEVLRAAAMASPHENVRQTAINLLLAAKAPELVDILVKDAAPSNPEPIKGIAVEALGKLDASDQKSKDALARALHDDMANIVIKAAAAFAARKDASALTELRAIKQNPPKDAPEDFISNLDAQIKKLGG